jgi:hypothetical protein
MDGLKITAAHEFFHAVQIGVYGIWTTIPNSDFYFYEITAVWMEDVLYDDVNDYYFDLPNYFHSFRDIRGQSFSFTLFEHLFYAGYERSVWAHFLAAKFGRGIVRDVWEAMKKEPFLRSMDNVLRVRGTDFATAYATFSQWNYFTADRADPTRYYPEGRYYPRQRPNVVQSVSGVSSTSVTLESPALATQFCEFIAGTDTITAIVANVDFSLAAVYSSGKAGFRVELSRERLRLPYQNLENGMRAGFAAVDPHQWRVAYVGSARRASMAIAPGPSPNPLRLSEATHVALPVTSSNASEAEVFFFSSSLDLRFSQRYPVTDHLGKQYVYVPTNDLRDRVSSGVYFLVVQCEDTEFRWKVVILQ